MTERVTVNPPHAPALPDLRAQLRAAYEAYPELRRSLQMALNDVDRRLSVPTSKRRQDRRRAGTR